MTNVENSAESNEEEPRPYDETRPYEAKPRPTNERVSRGPRGRGPRRANRALTAIIAAVVIAVAFFGLGFGVAHIADSHHNRTGSITQMNRNGGTPNWGSNNGSHSGRNGQNGSRNFGGMNNGSGTSSSNGSTNGQTQQFPNGAPTSAPTDSASASAS